MEALENLESWTNEKSSSLTELSNADTEQQSTTSLESCNSEPSDANVAIQTRRRSTKKTSIYRGVCWLPRRQAWRARIERNGNKLHIGYFASEIEAAKAYDKCSFNIGGHNGRFNFPEDFDKGCKNPANYENENQNDKTDDVCEYRKNKTNSCFETKLDIHIKKRDSVAVVSTNPLASLPKRRRVSNSSATTTTLSMPSTVSSPRSIGFEADCSKVDTLVPQEQHLSSTPPFSSRLMIPQSPITPVSGSRVYETNFAGRVSPTYAQPSPFTFNNKLNLTSSIIEKGCDKHMLNVHEDLRLALPIMKFNNTGIGGQSLIMNAVFQEIRRPSTALFQALIQKYR